MNRFERVLARWYGLVQPLSTGTRKWLAANLWLMALVGAILTVCMMFVFIPILLMALTLSSTISIITPYVPYYENNQGYVWVAFLTNILGCIIGALLLSIAVNPLRQRRRIGWLLVLWTLITGLVIGIVSGVVLYSPLAVFVTIVFVAVGGYFLFETREYFVKRRSR